MNSMMMAPILGKSFDSFFSILTLHQLHKSKGEHTLRLGITDPVDLSRSQIKEDKETNVLMDLYAIPTDLDSDFVYSHQDAYYVVSDYENILKVLDRIGLEQNKNLKKILIFICESKTSEDELAVHVRTRLFERVPSKWHQNIVFLDQLKLADFKALAKGFVDKDKDALEVVPIKEGDKKFAFVFVNTVDLRADLIGEVIYSLQSLDYLLIKSNPNEATKVQELLSKLDHEQMKTKNIFIQQDLMTFQEITGALSLSGCKEIVVLNGRGSYFIK